MTLFRFGIPDLYPFMSNSLRQGEHYICYKVDLNEWATSWLQYLLAKELQPENLMRLWDTYFAIPDPLDFHPFICLAILRTAKENLEELEQSEIRTLLLRLPPMDMEQVGQNLPVPLILIVIEHYDLLRPSLTTSYPQIINQAFNIRHETMEKQISDDLM
ncbi:rab-GTPase-TBC domain-containing protein [Jimgerdemannia flammicorona]|uniref:Rab-GTPase-TBC domain-containing protein n=1 Tax=Jimgerdemannia flammicorona TaxID=994334 RepID=A0A432ZZ76_9FUNG|nr:rab-GTPase-TBC domain-containing protein [Jimgerdemannia flammicorona]